RPRPGEGWADNQAEGDGGTRAWRFNEAGRSRRSLEAASFVRDLHVGEPREYADHLIVVDHLEARLHAREHDIGCAREDQMRDAAVLFAVLDVAFRHLGDDLAAVDDE